MEAVVINDVGPRDGLQAQTKILEVSEKLQLISALTEAKLPAIEVGAFVSPKAVPAMAGTDEIVRSLPNSDVKYSALIPNLRGYQNGKETGIPLMSLVVAVTNTMNEKNIRMTTDQALDVCSEVLGVAELDGIDVQAYVATAWQCPFEGHVAQDDVMRVTNRLLKSGAKRIVVADTIGAAAPSEVFELMARMSTEFGSDTLACHFHDTRGMGVADVYAALEAGIRRFDSAIAGLGGCPFAPGASGNVATEDVVLLCEQMGYDTGIDLEKLIIAADLAIALTGTAQGGRAKKWLEKNQQKIKS